MLLFILISTNYSESRLRKQNKEKVQYLHAITRKTFSLAIEGKNSRAIFKKYKTLIPQGTCYFLSTNPIDRYRYDCYFEFIHCSTFGL